MSTHVTTLGMKLQLLILSLSLCEIHFLELAFQVSFETHLVTLLLRCLKFIKPHFEGKITKFDIQAIISLDFSLVDSTVVFSALPPMLFLEMRSCFGIRFGN
ncbi:hypothetical protein VNO77_03236 [Canavalia gladiata]|uniref:Uncharacterized protein n=1 Tax=Canavalia gladiata TaxID=3824 RepID=A0AAN9R3N5_CANGL